jgi:TRAP-type mannitol/chloroaromatic compound transport system permease small subunit
MLQHLYWVDRFNAAVGKFFAWAIVVLMFSICYEVVARYAFSAPTTWSYDVSYMLYGTLFMTSGAYVLSRNGHVRGDFLYKSWSQRSQAVMDLVLYILFFFPGVLALVFAGYTFAEFSWMIREHSSFSPVPVPVYPFKTLIPITGLLLAVQGVVEVVRCIVCIRTGRWPQRLSDVEEMEKLILEQAAQAQQHKSEAESR